MGHCLRKELRENSSQGTQGEKKSRKRKQKNSPQEVSKKVVKAPKQVSELRASGQAEIRPEPMHVGHRPVAHCEPEAAAKKLRISVSEGNTTSGITSPMGSDLQNDSPISPIILGKGKVTSPIMRMFNSPKKLAPRVLFKSPLPKHLTSSLRAKNNSTSSLYITDTINAPNVEEIVRCMSVALLYHIKNGMAQPDGNIDRIFSERYHPMTKELLDLVTLPDVNTIFRYVNMIFQIQKLHAECAILCLAYIERILTTGRIVLHPENWRRFVFGAILIATKVWEDESVWNVDFLDIFPLLTLVDLNNLESRFMELLQFNVLIVGSEYAKYYFELRALCEKESFPLEPLNKEKQAKLEERGQKTNEQMSRVNHILREVTPKRSRSVDFFEAKSPPAVLA